MSIIIAISAMVITWAALKTTLDIVFPRSAKHTSAKFLYLA